MNANFTKRLSAYIIDIMVLVLIITFVSYLIPENHNIAVLNEELNNLNETYLKHQMSNSNYINQFSSIIHDLDKERIMYSIINSMFIIIYFVIIPYFKDGQTLGKQLLNIKIKRNDKELLTLNDLLIRNIIINGLGYMLVSLSLIYLIPSNYYFIFISFLGIIQFILVICTIFMILYRKDKRGLHDIISNTHVVKIKEEVKE